jgi:protein kinase A
LAGKVKYPSYFDPWAKDLVKNLLVSDLTKRFGNLKNGAEDIKRHPWFADIDWDKLVRMEIQPPYIPTVRHAGDASNFDVYEEDPEPYGKVGPDPYAAKFVDF